ncbi:MAG: hypothetical protein JHC85_06380, partial [Chthoniobacterales bacterium]|nr:hypothetical protein [Chthoniobacterales bacterium]
MIRALICAVLALSVGEARADWRTEAAALQPGPYPPPPDHLRARYVFGWGGFEAAAADVQLERGTGRTWNATVRG